MCSLDPIPGATAEPDGFFGARAGSKSIKTNAVLVWFASALQDWLSRAASRVLGFGNSAQESRYIPPRTRGQAGGYQTFSKAPKTPESKTPLRLLATYVLWAVLTR
jgi:hypothetical protein